MEKVVPRTIDDTIGNSVKPFHISTQGRSSPDFVTVNHATISTETKNSTNTGKFGNAPIHQPFQLNRPQNRSSMSSIEVDLLRNDTQVPPYMNDLQTNVLPRTTLKQIPLKKKSLFAQYSITGDEYATSPSNEVELTKTPPNSSTPRYPNSPPAGSGGKYMMKSKRASWIIDAGGPTDTTSTPSTPISLPENIKSGRSRKGSFVLTDHIPYHHHHHHHRENISLEEISTPPSTFISPSSSTSFMNDIKSGSISKLRQEKYYRKRNSSISSNSADNASSMPFSDEYASCNEVGPLDSCEQQGHRLSSSQGRNIPAKNVDLICSNIPKPESPFRNTPINIQGLPEYQESIQTFLKKQLSSTTALSPSSTAIIDADTDVVEIDLNDDFRNMDASMSFAALDGHNNEIRSPVYPAMFLNNNTINGTDNETEGSHQTEAEIESYTSCYHGNNSVYETEAQETDYFSLTVTQQGSQSVPIRRRPLCANRSNIKQNTYANKLCLSRSAKIKKWSLYHAVVPKWSNWMNDQPSTVDQLDHQLVSWWNSVLNEVVLENEVVVENDEAHVDQVDSSARRLFNKKYGMPLNIHNLQYQFPVECTSNYDGDTTSSTFGYKASSSIDQKSITTTATTAFHTSFPLPNMSGIAYRFDSPNKNPFAHFGKNYDAFESPQSSPRKDTTQQGGCPRHTIKARLRSAKDACNSELRKIIDGLNEYVEKGLLYFETANDVLSSSREDYSMNDHTQTLLLQHQQQYNGDVFNEPKDVSVELFQQYNMDNDVLEWDTLNKQSISNESLNDEVTFISEDAYLPTPFILTLQDLICLAQSLLDADLEMFLENSGACADTVSNIQEVGVQWDYHRDWPCREWYVRLLLSVAALNRVVEWWQAERSFWVSSSAAVSSTPTTKTVSNNTKYTVTPQLKPLIINTSSGSYYNRNGPVHSQHFDTPEDYASDSRNTFNTNDSPAPLTSDNSGNIRFSVTNVPRTRENSTLSFVPNDDERYQLQEEAEIGQSATIVMELTLASFTVQYLSPVWQDIIGIPPQSVIGLDISHLLVVTDKNVFKAATEEMLADDSKTVEVVFHIIDNCHKKKPLKMEGKGMLMYNRVTGDPSHTMWVIKSLETRRWSIIDNSSPLFASATESSLKKQESDVIDDTNIIIPSSPDLFSCDSNAVTTSEYLMPIAMRRTVSQGGIPSSEESEATAEFLKLPPALCNICEKWIIAVFFEQHSELCAEIHRAEMDVVTSNDSLTELKHYVQGLYDLTKSEVQKLESNILDQNLHLTVDTIIENVDKEDDGSSAINGSDSIFREALPIDEDKVGSVEKKIAELDRYMSLLDIMNVALSIATPGSSDDVNDLQNGNEGGLQENVNKSRSPRLKQSPLSRSKIIQILYWRAPQCEDADTESLVHYIEMIIKSKVDSVNRMQDCLEYNERTRRDFQLHVLKNNGCTEFVANTPENQGDQSGTFDVTDISPDKEHIEKDTNGKLENEVCITIGALQKMPFSLEASKLMEEKGSQNIRKSIFKKIKDLKLKGKRSSNKQSKRNGKKKSVCFGRFLPPVSTDRISTNPLFLPPGSVTKTNTTKIFDMELIETPIASPRFSASNSINVPPLRRSSLTNQQQQRIQHQSSGNSTPLGRSPLSPLPALITSTRPVAPSIKDFDIIKPISKGAFGSVFLAKKRVTGDYYAIKFLKKSDMIAKNQVTNVKAERMILMTQTDSPFVTKLYFTFQSKDYLYLVMEYLNGGDCSSLIKVLGSLPYDWARNYLAEVTLGLSYLHDNHIIHRDLKPDNLLIDQNGHLKLTDFGLSRIGFLDRRVRDEISNGPVSMSPSSPAHSQSGTVPQSPSVKASTSSNNCKLYKHSYFSLLFDQDRNRRGSLPSQVPAGNESKNGDDSTSACTILDQIDYSNQNILPSHFNDGSNANSNINSTTNTTKSRSNRQRTSSGFLSSGLTTPTAFANYASSVMDHHSANESSDTRRSQKQAIGTPDYLAPESILGTGQDWMVDWWALGVICYEFLYGHPPFHADSPDKVFENILSRKIDWHKSEIELPDEAYDFMERLLSLDPDKRLGRNGAEEVRKHAFFKNVDWEKLLTESPSFVPNPLNEEDTDYFDSRGATMATDQQQDNLQTLVLEDIKRAKAIINEQSPDSISLVEGNTVEGCQTMDDADFGTFVYKNLPVLEKANEDAIQKIRHQRLVASTSSSPTSLSTSTERSSCRPLTIGSRRKRSSIAEIIQSRHSSTSTNASTAPSLPASLISAQEMFTTTSTSLLSAPPLNLSPSNSASKTAAIIPSTHRRFSDMAHPPLSHVEKLKILKQSTTQRVRSISSPGNRVAVLAASAAHAPSSKASLTGSRTALSESPISASSVFACDSSTSSPLIESRVDNTFLLPLQISDPTHPLDCTSSQLISQSAKPLHCLIADDNPISCKILETILQFLQCHCVIVRNGAQAIRCAMGDKVRFDFIFMDIRMPIIDGEAAARMIKFTNNVNRNTPVIAITAYERTLQLTSIFDDTLSKPVTKESIIKCMRQVGNLSSLPSSIHNGSIHWSAPTSTSQITSTSSSTTSTKTISSQNDKVPFPSSVKENNHRIIPPESN